MTKIEELAQTYMKDVELASSKQKFGFFSIPPSAFAGNTTFEQKKGTALFIFQSKKTKLEKSGQKNETSFQACVLLAYLRRHIFPTHNTKLKTLTWIQEKPIVNDRSKKIKNTSINKLSGLPPSTKHCK